MQFNSFSADLQKQLATLQTPFFVYDLDKVKENYQFLVDRLEPDGVYFAVKSNSLPQILRTLSQAGSGFEVNSRMEMEKAVRAGADPKNMINSSPIKIPRELRHMYGEGVREFAFDSKDELDKLKEFAPGSSVHLRIYSQNEGSKWALNNKFGAEVRQALHLLEYAADSGLVPYGLTFHVGSQCTNTDNWEQAIKESAHLFHEFDGLEVLNIGGGLPASYKSNSADPARMIESINRSIDAYFDERPTLYVEPGRFITADAAITMASVIGTKEGDYLSWAYIDTSIFSGFTEIIEDAENSFEYNVEALTEGKEKRYNIAGASCAGSDVFARKVTLPLLNT